MGRRRLTLAAGDLPAALSSPVGSEPSPAVCSSGSRFRCLGSEAGDDSDDGLAARVALEELEDANGKLGWTTVSRRRRKSDEELRQDFWKEIGYPTLASRFWERGTPSSSQQRSPPLFPSSPVARRGSAASPVGVLLCRGPKVRPWKGPLPPRRASAPAVLGTFLAASEGSVKTGRKLPLIPHLGDLAHAGGPVEKTGSEAVYSWRAVARRLGLGRLGSTTITSLTPAPSVFMRSDRPLRASPSASPLFVSSPPSCSFVQALLGVAAMAGLPNRHPVSSSGPTASPAAVPPRASPPAASAAKPVPPAVPGHGVQPPGYCAADACWGDAGGQAVERRRLPADLWGFAGRRVAAADGSVWLQWAAHLRRATGDAAAGCFQSRSGRRRRSYPLCRKIRRRCLSSLGLSFSIMGTPLGWRILPFRCWDSMRHISTGLRGWWTVLYRLRLLSRLHQCLLVWVRRVRNLFGVGSVRSIRMQLRTIPDSVVRDHLGANLTPIALVQVTGPMVPADVVQRQIARRCPVRSQWKWEAMPYGESAFLVSFPSMEDLDRVDGIQVPVPLSTSQLSFSVYRTQEVPHKLELQQVWLHVEGVPHCLQYYLGLWAVGGLMGTTLDVDLFSLRRRGVVRILVAMTDTSVFLRLQDSIGHYIVTDAVVGLKAYELRFRLEPEGYVPEPEFAPFLWRKRDDDQDDDVMEKPSEDAMDTSDTGGGSHDVGAGSSSTSSRHGGSAQPPTRQGSQLDYSVPSDPVLLFVVTPFNANPATPHGKELLEALPLDSPLRGSGSALCSPRVSPSQLQEALHVACGSFETSGVSSLPASPTRGRPNMLGRSIPMRADPVLQEVVPVVQEVVSGSSARRLAQEGLADRGAVGLAAGAQGASPISLAVQPSSTTTRVAGGPSHGACPEGLEGRSSSDGEPVTGGLT
uniref:Uncharacterized protein n=1 Tax=Avena sativa TaxID=4498 RepID=A0ACD5TBC5_AVESA